MATFGKFDDESSGSRTPDPVVMHGSTWAQKGSASFEKDSQEGEPGSRTPSRVASVSIEALREKLERLKAANPKCFDDIGISPPLGLTHSVENRLAGDVMKVVVNSNLAQPLSAWDAAIKNKPVGQLVNHQVVSKGSVGHPFSCAQACKYVKRKGGCKEGTSCLNCHHCFWSKPHTDMQPMQEFRKVAGPEDAGLEEARSLADKLVSKVAGPDAGLEEAKSLANQFVSKVAGPEDARLEEAKSLANKLVSLLGGEEPFGSKPEETKVVKLELSVGTTRLPHNCAAAGKYARSNREAKDYSTRAGFSVAVQDAQGWEAGDSSRGAGFGTLGQDMQGSVSSSPPFISLNELLKVPPVLSTIPTHGQFQEELPAPQASPLGLLQLHASVGSVGHPHTCGPACKYAMKAKGCKDGPHCSHCHLCRWLRYGDKNGNKQATETTAWMSL